MSRMVFVAVIIVGLVSSISSSYCGGTGEPNNPYQICSAGALLAIRYNIADYNKCFILTADINLQGRGFNSNSVVLSDGNAFAGTFDGNGHKITNLTTTGGGIFGWISSNGSVKNLGIENCTVDGNLFGGGSLAGQNDGTISNCYSICDVNGNESAEFLGGLVAENRGSISNCYSTGEVYTSGGVVVGGLVGYNPEGSISNCYSACSVTGSDAVGGLVGDSYGSISNCYSIGPDNGFGMPLSDRQSSFVGWDFVNETTNGTCNYWQMSEGTYPILSIFNGYIPPEPNGSGTLEAPYIITDANGLGTIWYRPTANYLLANDINLVGIGWSMAVVPVFSGVLDGKGFCIKNISITGAEYLGLFGRIRAGGSVKNLSIKDCNISGSYYSVGGLAGENDGSISSCYSTGTVSSSSPYSFSPFSFVGGLVGENIGGSISNCYSTCSCSVTSSFNPIGGLVGENDGSISNCYSTGTVSGDPNSANFGGLVGMSYGNVVGSFWDTQTSGQTFSVEGIGLTTAQMKTLLMFTSAGWDFTNETANGTNDYWRMCEDGVNYPQLNCEYARYGDFTCPDGVNFADFAYFADRWCTTGCNSSNNFCGETDMNADAIVNFNDLAVLADEWLK